LTDAVEEFFNNVLKATEPEEAPNYDYIPYMMNEYSTVKSIGPLKGEALREVYKKLWENLPESEKAKIREAHKVSSNKD